MFKFRELTKKQINKIHDIENQVMNKRQLVNATNDEINALEAQVEKIRFPKKDRLAAFNELIMLPHNLITISVCPDIVVNGTYVSIQINRNIYLNDTKDMRTQGQYCEQFKYDIRSHKTQMTHYHEIDKCLTHRYAPLDKVSNEEWELTNNFVCALVSNTTINAVTLVFDCSDKVTQKVLSLFDPARDDMWEAAIVQAIKILKKEADLRLNPFQQYGWKLQCESVIKAFDGEFEKYLNQKKEEDE